MSQERQDALWRRDAVELSHLIQTRQMTSGSGREAGYVSAAATCASGEAGWMFGRAQSTGPLRETLALRGRSVIFCQPVLVHTSIGKRQLEEVLRRDAICCAVSSGRSAVKRM